jgi:heme A synthase
LAEKIPIEGASTTAKPRHPVAVALLSLVPFYILFWWYGVNREMADYGRAKGTSELGDSPLTSALALFPGSLIVVPAIWTTITTFKRIQAAQRIAGETPLNGWIGLLLYIVLTPAYYGYMQSGLNGVWRRQPSAETGGQRPEEAGGGAPQPSHA